MTPVRWARITSSTGRVRQFSTTEAFGSGTARKWFFATFAVLSNQKAAAWFSTCPLKGIVPTTTFFTCQARSGPNSPSSPTHCSVSHIAMSGCCARTVDIAAGAAGFWNFATPWGLMDILGSTITANFLGLSKATYPTFASRYSSNSGVARQTTESLIFTESDATMNEGGGMPLDFAIGEHSIRREIQALYQSRQEFGAVISEVGAKEKFLFNLGAHRIPFISNWLFPIGLVVMGVQNECGWYSLMDYSPLDEGISRRFVPDQAQSEEVYVSAGNWTCMAPNAFCAIDDLQASTQLPPAGGL
ncbi:MAG: hypothetical protein HC882_01470 [Acidobacteria bacterium]|nr:hypothetical protein [Acidobacteriota bacterium]